MVSVHLELYQDQYKWNNTEEINQNNQAMIESKSVIILYQYLKTVSHKVVRKRIQYEWLSERNKHEKV